MDKKQMDEAVNKYNRHVEDTKKNFFFDWWGQQEYLFKNSWELYKETFLDNYPEQLTAEEAIEIAYDFQQTYYTLVLNKSTKEYFNYD